jgi:Domain of unknown function (DUF4389)
VDARPVHAPLHDRLFGRRLALEPPAIVQFIWLLVARQPNHFIARFGNSLSIWLAEIGRFLTCTTDNKPFPWQPWPDSGAAPPVTAPS